MHVVFFGDQHLESLGGAQVSMRLQRTYLERAGHRVTVVAPRMHGPRAALGAGDSGYLNLPSMPITLDREYSMSWPGRRTDVYLDLAFRDLPPVDLVHVQADFWGAFIGHRFARRHGIPVVHTMHNRVEVGIAAVTPLHRQVLWVLNAWRRRAVGGGAGSDGWAYLRGIAAGSRAVTAPSGHFARRLEQHGVFSPVEVVWNGIDDEMLAEVRAEVAKDVTDAAPRRPRFIWLGRMSPEKRLLPFLEAVVASEVDADVEIIGGGGQLRAAERIAARATKTRIRFAGRVSYRDVLLHVARADAVVQTSIGFETQGMTPFEAATLGTPTIVSDSDIAGELRGGLWAVPDVGADEASRIAALAETLRIAAADIRAGTAPSPHPAVVAEFTQSSRTAAMIEVYERVLREAHGA
ncbi:glycosyltransferase family 4 protein [Microbacterium keratanolyticum]